MVLPRENLVVPLAQVVVHEEDDSRRDVEDMEEDVTTIMEEAVVAVATVDHDMGESATKSEVVPLEVAQITTVATEIATIMVDLTGMVEAAAVRSAIHVTIAIRVKKDVVAVGILAEKSVVMATTALHERAADVRLTREIVDTMRGVTNATLVKKTVSLTSSDAKA